MVFKESPSRVPETAAENVMERHGFGAGVWGKLADARERTPIYANASGWLTGKLVVQWLELNLSGNTEKILLLLDKFSGHWTDEVLNKCEELSITLMEIPAGCTSVSQPVDVAWNRPFKNHIRKAWAERLIAMCSDGGKLKAPERCEVVEWIINSWNKVSSIEGGFMAAHLVDVAAEQTEIILEGVLERLERVVLDDSDEIICQESLI